MSASSSSSSSSSSSGQGRRVIADFPPVAPGSGRPIPDPIRHQMESAFGADLSDVRVHETHQATMLGANAYTEGNNIHFAPGQYDIGTPAGREMLAHEAWHVVQQKQGRVQPMPQL